jgi:SHS2 domain-containing protein
MSRAEGADYEFVEDVTSDLSFRARGSTPEAVFTAAAAALLAATVEDPASVRERERRPLELTEPDLELLMLRFLNELIYLRDAEELLLRAVSLRIEVDGDARLEGELAGEKLDRSRHVLAGEVKAATAHGLRVAPRDGAWVATVTLDV